jgi:hypothetical protein
MDTTDFDKSIKSLNAQFWLLMASTEHLNALAQQVGYLDGSDHRAVLGGLMFGARTYGGKVRLRNESLASDLSELALGCKAWLPSYFLILAKSLAEGHLIEMLDNAVSTSKATASKLDAFRKSQKGKQKPSRKKAIEAIAQRAVRGSYDDLGQVIDIASVRSQIDALASTLSDYAKVRNQLAHRLATVARTKPSTSTQSLKEYLATLTKLVKLIFPH